MELLLRKFDKDGDSFPSFSYKKQKKFHNDYDKMSESEPAGACSRMASGECGPQAEPEANRSESGLQAKPDVRRLCL